MELIREYWWLIVVVVALVLAFILLRPKQRVQLTDSAPVRPHMVEPKMPAEGRGLAGEAVAATTDLTGDILQAPVHATLEGESGSKDDFSRIKGVGPRFADALHGLGYARYEQLAQLSAPEVERLDSQLGAFSGRIARDRVVEQADYLARDDIDGFEQKFGKL
jgi:predicted flap endonuclease-1-like 5' DNA nuclease